MSQQSNMTTSANEEVPAGKHAEVEIVTLARRRQFSSAYKRRIVRETADLDGGVGVLRRREGLYSSHLTTWRREVGAAETRALAPKMRAPKVDVAKVDARRNEALERANARLRQRLDHAEHIIAAQKKLCELLGLPTDEGAPR